ncbi:MAG TPA: helix-turn-helix transcriptional regulator [Nocardioidaceae bacterium]|nr:helix-turn-helix transcriptional regulator [Nocardioidaceae bacterium]
MTAGAQNPRRMLGEFLRAQRQMANLSLRQLSALTEVSNPYLSQVERGLHEPSVRVLKSIADALNVSAETLFEQAGLISGIETLDDEATEAAIRSDQRLTESQRRALLSVYRSYVEANTEVES